MQNREVGNNGFVRQLHEEFSAELFEYALMLTANYSDAEDVIQNVFMRLTSKGRDSQPESWIAYIKTAVRNECYDLIKSKRTKLTRLLEFFEKGILEPVDSGYENKYEKEQLEVALKRLPIEQREVVYLKVYRQMSFAEIGWFLDESPNTASSRYRYGIAKLKTTLKSRSRELFDE